MAILEAAVEQAHITARNFSAEISMHWESAGWTGGRATPFQRREWLDALYGAASLDENITPLIATIRGANGDLAMRLPLLVRHKNSTIIEFADLGLTDFNAPLLGPAAPKTKKESRMALRALRRALPKADLLSLEKMPPVIDGKPNPFSALSGARPSAVNGNVIALPDDWETYHRSRHRNFRMEIGRCWRLFEKNPGAQFRAVRDPQEAQRILGMMETQQRERMKEVGAPYMLDEPVAADFYRRLLAGNVEAGYALLTILMVGEELVAASLGVYDRNSFVAIRLSNAGRKWSNISPGRLVIEKTLQYLHADGCRVVDFSIGNYAYKRRFGVTRTPLLDYSAALSWRGLPKMLKLRLAGTTRQSPKLHAFIRKALGKPASHEEI